MTDASVSPLAFFETLGDLYYRRYHRLRPGKDEPPEAYRDSCSDENVEQYSAWLRDKALSDAVARIVELEQRIYEMEHFGE